MTLHKFYVAAAAAIGVLATAMQDGHLTNTELAGVAVAFIGAFFVWAIPNQPTN